MFKLFMVLLAMSSLSVLIYMSGSSERAEQARYSAQRIDNQDAILTNLLALNDKDVSTFVTEWRAQYPRPTQEQLSELKEIQQRIKNDKKEAVKMTRAYKMEHDAYCRGDGEIEAVFSFFESTPDCPPGI